MRLGINGFFWSQETTGSGQYTRHLVRGLVRMPEGPEGLLLNARGGESASETLASGSRIRERFLSPPGHLSENLSKLWFEQISFPRACLAEQLDVAHVPYFAPPLRASTPVVVTIHDLIPLVLPAYRGSTLVRLYTRLVAAGATRAAAIVTDSRASKRDITGRLRIPEDRVHVVYLAADEMYQPVEDVLTLSRIRQKYGLPGQYVLYLGGFDRRKNLTSLLSAFGRAKAALRAGVHLVIAGHLPEENSAFFPDPRLIVQLLGMEDRVSFIGWVPEEDKPALYSGASLFVFPSLYEGFGLPPLEAMACGTAVITSNHSSLREIGDGAALLVDPEDVDAIARAITILMEDEVQRKELAAKGLMKSRQFSWQRTVTETMAVYESVAAG